MIDENETQLKINPDIDNFIYRCFNEDENNEVTFIHIF
jgi:hypothetical protein